MTANDILGYINTLSNESVFNDDHCYDDLNIADIDNSPPNLRRLHASLNKTIVFSNCTFDKKVSIHITAINLKLEFNGCTFSSEFEFNSIRDISITNCQFKFNAAISPTPTGHFTFNNNILYTDLLITGHKEELRLSGNSNFDENGRVQISISSQQFRITNCKFNYIDFDKIGCEFVVVSKSSVSTLSFVSGKYHNIFLRESKIGLLLVNEILTNISLNILNNTEINFSAVNGKVISNLLIVGGEIIKLQFEGITNESQNYKIQELRCKELAFNNFICQANVSFIDVTIEKNGMISFISSDLKDIQFINCTFLNAFLKFENSKISEVFTAETDFPKNVICDERFNKWSQARLAFGQLANSYKAQGDTVRYLDYQSRELHAHMKKLDFRDDPATFINLWANYFSNNFGRNWILCTSITFALGILLFYFLVVSTVQYSIGWGWHVDSQMVNWFFHFFNPIRSTDTDKIFEIDGKQILTLGRKSYVIDFCSHILLAFLFYQTISAFRRYGRSN